MRNSAPDVSVIIAAYNCSTSIVRAIESAFKTKLSVEVIVVDDCSTDNTVSIVEELAHPNVKLIELQTNGGPSCARNHGIQVAQGKWLAILDSDDEFFEGRLDECIEAAELDNSNVVVDNLLIHYCNAGTEDNMFSVADMQKKMRLDLVTFIKSGWCCAQGYDLGYLKPIFKNSFIKNNDLSYPENIKIGEDYILLYKALFLNNGATVLSKPGYKYYAHNQSISYRMKTSDVQGMIDGDIVYLSALSNDPNVLKARQERQRQLQKRFKFGCLVDSLKEKRWLSAFVIAFRQPNLLLMFKEALFKRLKIIKS